MLPINFVVYDNINMMLHVAEQAVGRNDSQENETCATVWPLWNASEDDMKLTDFEKLFNNARQLSFKDVILNQSERTHFRRCLIHCVLHIIVLHGGEHFHQFRRQLEDSQPMTYNKIEVHKTSLHPFPAMNIDESTIVGNGEVVEAIMSELRIEPKDPIHNSKVKIFAGDQLSIARLWTLANIRAGQEGGFASFGWGGKPNSGTRNPESLWFHNTRVHYHPITLTSLDLVFVSLYACVLHCLLLVSSVTSLEDCSKAITSWETLKVHAGTIVDKYTDNELVAVLREQQEHAQGNNIRAGDMVFENAVLFFNWLVNPTGKQNSFVEVDLMQEHMDYWIKNFYRAHGSSASWEWLEMVAPCVNILQHLSQTMSSLLGTKQGLTHEPLDLTRDIPVLMSSLMDHEVYSIKHGRQLDEGDLPVPDVITIGLQQLTDATNNPIEEYNKVIKRLQARRQLQPVIGPGSAQPMSAQVADTEATTTPVMNDLPGESSTVVTEGIAGDEDTDMEEEEEEEEEGDFEHSAREDEREETLTLEGPEDILLDMDTEDMGGVNMYEESEEENETDIDNDTDTSSSDCEM
ncbi:hypothetical protein SERLADRAFT_367811 [Serpula lacrymans var. lacrymans S7.9]|uniref:DUF6589 domain-containing protein n=1 Tax=Serpula lacrymans var. lacrymans (strain S7.9) TaxID=578457 RepID=F8NR45_SERL9|nr:uncharacterized protein SERLADRAFT_367811 [Serpula lacrymans var. lacrymans S7.9]EGO26218.1 hypothetical protein SERLADRAFT_367811 [Serpula lacrymans var. lacrymans S7.9]